MTRQSLFSVKFLVCVLLFGLSLLNGQDEGDRTTRMNDRFAQSEMYQGPGTSFYLEVGGKGFYSINADFRKNEHKAASAGIQVAENALIPSLMMYRFRGKNYRTEFGGGFSAVLTQEDGLAGIFVHGVYGYRYQKKNGLLFRISFTPLMGIPLADEGRFIILPWIGLSLGYSR